MFTDRHRSMLVQMGCKS